MRWLAVLAVVVSCAPHAGPTASEAAPAATRAQAASPGATATVTPEAAATGLPARAPTVTGSAHDATAAVTPEAAAAGPPVRAPTVTGSAHDATAAVTPEAAAAGPPARAPMVNGPSPAAAAGPPAPACAEAGKAFDPEALRAHVAYLASTELDGRAAGSAGDAAARAYLAERFRCLGLVPGGAGGGYAQPFVADGRPTANLIGYLPGGDAAVARDIIVVGAHHDHLGDGHLGANDNASGAAALLAIAQALRDRGTPRRTIAFVLFGGEELGLLGSAYFAAHPPAALPAGRVVYDVNLDMVGSYASAGAVYAMGTFRGLPATAIVKALAAERPALHVAIGGRGAGSDHEAFCRAGVPYVFFWTPDRRCYHARCDTTERLDVAHLAAIAALAGDLVARLSDAPGDLAAARGRLGCTGR